MPSVLTRPASLALAESMNRVTAIRVLTVTATGTAFSKLSLLGESMEGRAVRGEGGRYASLPPGSRLLDTYQAGELAAGPMPPRRAGTGSSLGAAGCPVGTLAAGIATEAPGSRWAGHRAVTTLPTWKRSLAGRPGDPAPLPSKHTLGAGCARLCAMSWGGVGVLLAQCKRHAYTLEQKAPWLPARHHPLLGLARLFCK